jgi:glycosyltransferase involved in cell wall biosynthesis
MKIIIVQDYLRSGGTERQSVLLANAFSAAGHDTSLLTFRPGGPLRETVGSAVSQIVLQNGDARLDWLAPRLTRTVQKHHPDIVLCMGRMANCYAGRLQDQCTAARVVMTIRTGKPLPWLFRRSLHRVRHVVANSHEARLGLTRDEPGLSQKISVIHNSLVFPPAVTRRHNEELRTRQGATAHTVVLLCVAMFRPEKNQKELIETTAELPRDLDWQLWLAGDGPARAECEKLVTRKQLGHRVVFPGYLPDPSRLYDAADVAVHASTSESLSNFFIEAQARGLPAVAYSVQGISETFLTGHTGWEIPRGDRKAFCQRITQLAGEPPDVRASRASDARAFARETFDSARQVERYLELFASLGERRP